MQKNYCPFCANPLTDRFVEGRTRRYCTACAEPIYENPVPACCTVVVDPEERLLLVKRNVPPKIGEWCLPGGFMEVCETPEATALRELKEETGVSGKIDRLLGVTSHSSGIYGSVLITGYLVRNFSGTPIPGDDADDVHFFAMDDLPELAFDSHMRFIRIYRATCGPLTCRPLSF